MVDNSIQMLNPPLVDSPQFNQFMTDEELNHDIKSNTLCRLFYNLDLERIGGNTNVSEKFTTTDNSGWSV